MKKRLLDIYNEEYRFAYFKSLEINKLEMYDSNKGFVFFLLYSIWKSPEGVLLFNKCGCKFLREEGKYNIYYYIKEYGFYLGE